MKAAAVVLAAGRSTRLGAPKQLLDLGGVPLIRRTVANILAAASLAEVVVVTGAEAEAVAAALAGLPCRLVHNPDYAAGMGTSLRVGVAALAPEAEVAVICLGDQPLVGPAVLDALVAALAGGGDKSIARPVYAGRPGHPVAFHRQHFPALLAAGGDTGGREVVAAHRDQVAAVPFADDAVALDVDTWEDYEQVRRRAGE